MESRFINYNCLVTYIGKLDSDSLGVAINEIVSETPEFIKFLDHKIFMDEFKPYQLVRVNLLFFIERGIFSEEEKINYVNKFRQKLDAKIEEEMKNQKVMFIIETN